MESSYLPIQPDRSLPIRLRYSPDDILVEIPNRWVRLAMQRGRGFPETIPPSPYGAFSEKIAWFLRQLNSSGLMDWKMLLGGVALVMVLAVPILRPLLLLLLGGGLLLLYQLQSTFIHFSRSRNLFLVYRALFPVLPRRYDDRLARITDIRLDTPDWVNPANRVVARLAIHTPSRKFTAGEGLNKEECRQLAQILCDWCQFPERFQSDPAIAPSPDGDRHSRTVGEDEQGSAIGGEPDPSEL